MVLQQQPVQMERPALDHTVPENGHKTFTILPRVISLYECCVPIIKPRADLGMYLFMKA